MPPQNMPLWHKHYFELIILRNITTGKALKKVEGTLLKEKFTFINEIFICKGVSFSVPGREG